MENKIKFLQYASASSEYTEFLDTILHLKIGILMVLESEQRYEYQVQLYLRIIHTTQRVDNNLNPQY